MKTLACFLVGLCLGIPVLAQQDAADPVLPPEELDKLVAPIALYPDSLVALILPASTISADVVIAARYFAAGGGQDEIENQPWAESVKALAHYPDVVKWMDENLSWTRQMGDVFAAQPADVMNAIQRMRSQAREAGLLNDTPQQKVVIQDQEICIVPAEPDIIYVPRYDPEILWMRRPYHGEFITFGIGFGIGSWLVYDCDWHERAIWVHHRNPGWVYRPGWRRPMGERHEDYGQRWHPDVRRYRSEHRWHQGRPEAIRPHMMPGNDSRRDFHGQPDRGPARAHPPGPHFGPTVGNIHNRTAPLPPPDRKIVPPDPVNRPRPQAGPQSPRRGPFFQNGSRENGRVDHRPNPGMSGPPSHTPPPRPTPPQGRGTFTPAIPAPAARPPAGGVPPSAAPAPAGRGTQSGSGPAANAPSRGRPSDDKPGRNGPWRQP